MVSLQTGYGIAVFLRPGSVLAHCSNIRSLNTKMERSLLAPLFSAQDTLRNSGTAIWNAGSGVKSDPS